jgi:hypothetical protein
MYTISWNFGTVATTRMDLQYLVQSLLIVWELGGTIVVGGVREQVVGVGNFEDRFCALVKPRTREKHCPRVSQVSGLALESELELSKRVMISSSEIVDLLEALGN